MKRIARNIVLSLAVAATTAATIPAAGAGERWHRHRGDDRVVMRHNGDAGALVAAGILGLAVGAIAAGAAQQQPRYTGRVYPVAPDYEPRRVRGRAYRDYGDRYEYEGGYGAEPWTRAWFRYCKNRYRSFDPQSGTFLGYDGERRFCVAN